MAVLPLTRTVLAAAAVVILGGAALAVPAPLAPFKDALFAYPPLTATSDDGDFIDVDYAEMRDINGRDEIPERRVKPAYVDLAPLASQQEASVPTAAGPLAIMTVGDTRSPTSIVLFIHGRNGDRRLGMNDRTFGGNFNRLKNLMTRSGGLYVTADAGSFSEGDRTKVATLLESFGRDHSQATIVLACASMGGEFCWDLAGEPAVLGAVDGLVMLSANTPPQKLVGDAQGRRSPPDPAAPRPRHPGQGVFLGQRQGRLRHSARGDISRAVRVVRDGKPRHTAADDRLAGELELDIRQGRQVGCGTAFAACRERRQPFKIFKRKRAPKRPPFLP